VGTLALSGCGVTTYEQAYSPKLIRQVGAGSVAEAKLLPTVQTLKTSPLFSDPGVSQAMQYLFDGRLNKLSEDDLNRMASVNRAAANATGPVVAQFNSLERAMRTSAVDTGSFGNLASGSKAFIERWNQYLRTNANALHGYGAAIRNFAPFYKEFPGLLRAARDTANLHSTVQFDKVRQAVLTDLKPRFQQMQSAMQSGKAAASSERQFFDFVNHNKQAQAIVTKVNHDYPGGWLAQDFKAR
jgi:hypothetical protein